MADQEALENEAYLLDRGGIVSTDVLEIIFAIEETFGIRVEDSGLLPDNIDTISDREFRCLQEEVESLQTTFSLMAQI